MYNFHEDSGHGWLEVGREELAELQISSKISGYSYQMGNRVYLEEDCDAPKFCDAFEQRYGRKTPIEWYYVDGYSEIRNYPNYHA